MTTTAGEGPLHGLTGSDLFRRLACATCFALTLVGCGGGGGDGDAGPTSPPNGSAESNVPLRIVEGQEKPAMQVPTIYAESLLALAYDIDQWTRSFAEAPRASLAQACAQGGSLAMAWTDVNGDAQLGVGDGLRLDLSDCMAPASATRYTGAIQLAVLAPGSAGALAMQVSTASTGLRFSAGNVVAAWKGSYRAERLVAARRDEFAVRVSAADQLRVEFSAPDINLVDRILAANITRNADADRHGTTSSFALSLASDVLRGRLELSTPTPLFAHFDTYPLRGVIEVVGVGRVRVQAIPGTQQAWLSLLEGVGAGAGYNLYWSELMAGLAWVGGGPLPDRYATVQELSAVPFGFVDAAATTTIEPAARQADWQLNRELQISPAISAARLTRIGEGWGSATIDAAVEVAGGHLRLRWSEQLEPGASYSVTWLSGSPQQAVYLQSAEGQRLPGPHDQARLAARNSVVASIDPPRVPLLLPGAALRLDARASNASARTIASYRWTQTSGPPLQLSGSDQPMLDIMVSPTLGAPPSDAEIQLEVSDTQGVTDRQTVRLQAVPSPSTSILATLRGSPGDPLLDGAASSGAAAWWTAARLDSGSSLFVRAFVNFGAPLNNAIVFFFLPTGAALQPGTYSAPASAFERGDGPGFLISGNTNCSGPASFTIYEAELGVPDGSIDGTPIASFAADFTVSCAGTSPVSGAIRIGSARPLPP